MGLNGFYDAINHIMIKLVVDKYQKGEKTVFLGNIVEDMSVELNKSLSVKKSQEYEYRTNINILAGVLKTYFIYFFCTQAINEKLREHYYKEMLKYIKKNLVLVKKGKKNPRNRRVSRKKLTMLTQVLIKITTKTIDKIKDL